MRAVLLSLFLLLILLCTARGAQAQQDGLLQIDDPLHQFLLRHQAGGHLPRAHLSHQPLSAYEARRYLDSLALQHDRLHPVDRMLLARFRGERPGPHAAAVHRHLPFLYRNGRDVFSVQGEDYGFQVSPLLYLTYGRARQSRPGHEATVPTWQNTRGVRLAGHVGPALFFETRVEETQRRAVQPAYVRFTAPRLGFTRLSQDSLVYDYQLATAVLGLHTRHFEVRFGRDRNRWGFGQGSLALSNYAAAYDQLQIRTTVWHLQYVNLFTAMTDVTSPATLLPDEIFPRRYGAFHQLSLRLSTRLQLELFEGVIFAPDTTAGGRRTGFDLSYLNPVMFYRVAEADRGSPDNILLGGGLSWIVRPGLRLYGQLVVDELQISQVGRNWWGNKWGWLAGLHLADLPVPRLSARLEYARLRPFLYSHETPRNAYVHFRDLLGHPAGPNAEDVALLLHYRPTPRLHAALNLAYTRRGRNTPARNHGSDPLLPYHLNVSGTRAYFLQGVRQHLLLVEGYVGYEILPDLFLEAALQAESVRDAETGQSRYAAPLVLLRWGLPFQSVRY